MGKDRATRCQRKKTGECVAACRPQAQPFTRDPLGRCPKWTAITSFCRFTNEPKTFHITDLRSFPAAAKPGLIWATPFERARTGYATWMQPHKSSTPAWEDRQSFLAMQQLEPSGTNPGPTHGVAWLDRTQSDASSPKAAREPVSQTCHSLMPSTFIQEVNCS